MAKVYPSTPTGTISKVYPSTPEHHFSRPITADLSQQTSLGLVRTTQISWVACRYTPRHEDRLRGLK
jgi:hypothetical protein